MASMALLHTIRTFFIKNPAYEPDLNELIASIYVLSCRAMGDRPQKSLMGTAYRRQKQRHAT